MNKKICVGFLLFLISTPCFATQMAFVFKGYLCSVDMCLNGNFQIGQVVTILSKDSEKVCTAQVGESFTAEDEMLKFPAAKLTELKGCNSVSEPFLAIFETKVKYSVPKATNLSASDLGALNKKVKASTAFMEVYESAIVYDYEKKKGESYSTYKLDQLRKSEPTGTRYVIKPGRTLDIIWHKVGKGGSAEGALFGIYQEKISPVSGLFKLSAPYVFLLNDKIYVLSSKSCQLGCGEVTNEVYEYSDSGFSKIYSNSDFST